MKVWFEVHNPRLGRVMFRITEEYKKHAPKSVEFVPNIVDADLVISHVLGTFCARRILAYDKPFIAIQHCLKTGGQISGYEEMWNKAHFVSGYDNLQPLMPRFLRLPWGVDTDVFYPITDEKIYMGMTHGYSAKGEPIIEWHDAARALGKQSAHLNSECYVDTTDVTRFDAITDAELARIYSQSYYTSAMRFVEGFEVPGIEALACGSRPITFDLECFEYWYGDLAEYVPYTHDREELKNKIQAIFAGAYRPVTEEEIARVKAQFSWKVTAEEFWSNLP
jgi:glycosyltransferase involved in cell wall biosynthesis